VGKKNPKPDIKAMPFRESGEGKILEVRVQPRSSRTSIEKAEGGVLRVKLTAPPVGGAANAQLIELLSGELGVRKTSIEIIRGLSSRNKTVRISE
jgi:uncharacterized protein (TIGR00251 family)